MGGSDLTDLFKQLPIGFFVVPLVAGGLYVAMMTVIFRRARERRRRAREALGLNQPEVQAPKPAKPAKPVITPLPEPDLGMILPEPTLDLLAVPAEKPVTDIIEADVVESAPVRAVSRPVAKPVDYEEAEIIMPPEDAVEVMRVYRDLNDGSLIIQMGNQRYRAVDEIDSADLQRRFSAVVRDLSAMTGSLPTGAPTNVLQPRASGTVPIVGEPARPAPTGVESERMSRFKKMSTPPVVPPSRKGSSEPVPAESIGEAVEDYLQARLLGTPSFSTRSIHIRPAHDHGVRIEVDGHYYESVSDIVDADVREFLMTVMKEWEARH